MATTTNLSPPPLNNSVDVSGAQNNQNLNLSLALATGVDVCPWLAINSTPKVDSNNLTGKFAVLDAAGWAPAGPLFHIVLPHLVHQYFAGGCAYQYLRRTVSTVVSLCL
jgi:hypothetical protein